MLRRVSLLLSVISEFYNLEHWYLLIIYLNEGPWKSISRWRHFTTRPTICIYDQNPLKFCLIVQLIQRRSVTSHYHGSKIIFLESDGHFHCRAMKEKWKSKVLFLSAIMQRKVINVFFFPAVLAWERTRNDFFSLFSLLLFPRKNEKDRGRSSQMTPSCKRPMDKSCDKKNWTQRPLATPGQHRGTVTTDLVSSPYMGLLPWTLKKWLLLLILQRKKSQQLAFGGYGKKWQGWRLLNLLRDSMAKNVYPKLILKVQT